jgi:hypothetical protein
MDDLPMLKNAKNNFKNGLIVMDDLSRLKNAKIFQE